MGKVKNLHKLVPCRSKCKKLSKEEFKNTALVWFQVPETSFDDSFWMLESREKLVNWQMDLSKEIYYPAPTAQEFMDKMQTLFVGLEGTSGDYLAHHISDNNQSYWGHGKSPVMALYNCYMDFWHYNE